MTESSQNMNVCKRLRIVIPPLVPARNDVLTSSDVETEFTASDQLWVNLFGKTTFFIFHEIGDSETPFESCACHAHR